MQLRDMEFYSADKGVKDVFVHIRPWKEPALSNLNEGAKVSYEEMGEEPRQTSAEESLRVAERLSPVNRGLFPAKPVGSRRY